MPQSLHLSSQNLISGRWSLLLPTNPVCWGSMHAISSYHGNRPTNKQTHTHRQGQLQYTAPLSLVRSVNIFLGLSVLLCFTAVCSWCSFTVSAHHNVNTPAFGSSAPVCRWSRMRLDTAVSCLRSSPSTIRWLRCWNAVMRSRSICVERWCKSPTVQPHSATTSVELTTYRHTMHIAHCTTIKVKVKVYTLDIAPLHNESPQQKRTGMARVPKGFHSFTCTPTRSSTIGMSYTYLCLPSRSWYSFTDPGGMDE